MVIRGFGGCDVAFVKKSGSGFVFSKRYFFNSVYKVFLPHKFSKFTRNHGFGNYAYLTGFIKGFGGCDVAFVKKSVSCFVFFETMLFRQVL